MTEQRLAYYRDKLHALRNGDSAGWIDERELDELLTEIARLRGAAGAYSAAQLKDAGP